MPLSNDAIFDILSRTPVRSVCRFRCVSRGWRDLISGPDFAAAHRSRHGPLLVDTGYFRQEKPAAGRDMRLMDMEGNVIRVIRVVGGFGITCSSSLDDLIAVSRGSSNGIHVVDPVSGETLDVHPFIGMARYEIYGFGRAISSDEYKVVRIRETPSPPISMPTDVGSPVAVNGIMYSLCPEILVLEMVISRLILIIDTSILSISRTSISRRREYFLADEKRETLLCFNIESEQWKANMIKGPRKGDRREMRRKTAAICISELNGALCMVIAEKQDNRSTNIWILDDSGKINWTKAYSIPMTPYTSRYMLLMVMPGVILQIYDHRTNTFTHVTKAPNKPGDRIAICNFGFSRRFLANN
ncbi:hypothetical protein VPH35_049937 [Triticum aestivum]